jgi:hypothetical protein
MQLFHPSYIRSHRYNYTVDYFELRAQSGRDVYSLVETGGGDSLWTEEISDVLIHPVNLSNAVVIGGTVLRGSEMLRVVGSINIERMTIGGSYITETNGGLMFFDNILNREISLSDIISQYWTRNATYGWLLPKNGSDSLLLGQTSGSALKRLQITSERDDGSSHILFSKNSSGVDIFNVSDQGSVYLKGNLLFSTSEYISRTDTYLDFTVESLSGLKIYKDKMEGSAFLIKSTDAFYSRVGYPGDGLGFPANNEVAIYTNNINSLNISATQITFPKDNWIYSGKNLLRVRTDDIIELGTFAFDDIEKIFYITPDVTISKDPVGNMMFDDEFVGPVSLTQLLSTSTNYFDRSPEGILSPRITTDVLTLPVLAGTGTRIVFITTDGTLIPGDYVEPIVPVSDILYWNESSNKYTPYAAQSDGKFDLGTVDPVHTTRLNYDGYFYSTKLYSQYLSVNDGSLRHLYINSGNVSATGQTAGDLIIKSGDAIFGDATTHAGSLYLSPGGGTNAGNAGYIYLGHANYPGNNVGFYPAGTLANITLSFNAKGNGNITFWSNNVLSFVGNSAVYMQSPRMLVTGGMNFILEGAMGWNHAGYDVTIKGGYGEASVSTTDLNGGNVYIYGGLPHYSGVMGNVYFGNGGSGFLPAKSSETNVVFYNPATGLLTYGVPAGGGGGVTITGTPSSGTISLITGADTITGDDYFWYDSSTLYVNSIQSNNVNALSDVNNANVMNEYSNTIWKDSVIKMTLNPEVNNSGDPVAYMFDTFVALTMATTRLFSIRNYGTEKFYIDKDGNINSLGIVEYTDNAAAVSAGLSVGTFYRTGDLLKVVH